MFTNVFFSVAKTSFFFHPQFQCGETVQCVQQVQFVPPSSVCSGTTGGLCVKLYVFGFLWKIKWLIKNISKFMKIVYWALFILLFSCYILLSILFIQFLFLFFCFLRLNRNIWLSVKIKLWINWSTHCIWFCQLTVVLF